MLNTEAPRVVVVDYGAKGNIVECLSTCELDVIVEPADTPSVDILAHEPDGILISNGLVDPDAMAPYSKRNMRNLVDANMPIFGICFGQRLLACMMDEGGSDNSLRRHRLAHDAAGKAVRVDGRECGLRKETDIGQDAIPQANVTNVSLLDDSSEGGGKLLQQTLAIRSRQDETTGTHLKEHLFDKFVERVRERKRNRI